MNKEVSKLVQNKHTEIHYNQKYIKNPDGRKIHLNMQGKIKCPVLNQFVSSIVCSKLMDKKGWPRNEDPEICKKCGCFIHKSIKKFSKKKKASG